MHEMLHEKGVNWAVDVEDRFKNGGVYVGGHLLNDVIFKEQRALVDSIVYSGGEER